MSYNSNAPVQDLYECFESVEKFNVVMRSIESTFDYVYGEKNCDNAIDCICAILQTFKQEEE